MSPGEIIRGEYQKVHGVLRQGSRRLRAFRALEGGLLVAISFLSVTLLGLFLGPANGLSTYLPFIYSVGAFLILSFTLFLFLRGVLLSASERRVASLFEKRFPELKDDLTNSLELYREVRDAAAGPVSERLVWAQVRRTGEKLAGLDLRRLTDPGRVKLQVRVVALVAVAFVGAYLVNPASISSSLSIMAQPWAYFPEGRTHISLEPRDVFVARGTPVTLRARTTGSLPQEVTLRLWPEGAAPVTVTMGRDGPDRFSYLVAGAVATFGYQAMANSQSTQVYWVRVVDPPDIAELKLTYFPPDYSGLPKDTSSEGNVEALKGTIIRFEVLPTKPVVESLISLTGGSRIALGPGEGGKLRANLVLLTPGEYAIGLRDSLGFSNTDPARYQLRVIPDREPEVEIEKPAQDMEVEGSEIVPIRYRARDDFGLTAIKLVFRKGAGAEVQISLPAKSLKQEVVGEEYQWDLDSLALTPGERVIYSLEAVDNDTVSGPKVGRSKSFAIVVRDRQRDHVKSGQELDRIADGLVNLLADNLEYNASEGARPRDKWEGMTQRLDQIREQVDRGLERLKRTPGEEMNNVYDMEALQRNLSLLKERMDEAAGERVTSELEKMAILAEEMAKRSRMEQVQDYAKEIRNRQRRLIDSLESLKERFNRQGMEAALKELGKLGELLKNVMDALTRLATQLPDEFLNSDALNDLNFQDLFQGLDQIRKKLMEGDLAGALEAAREMLQSLSQMLAALGQAGSQASQAPFGRMRGEMMRSQSELSRLVAEQREILESTERVEREAQARRDKEVSSRLERFRPSAVEQSAQLEELLQLPEHAWLLDQVRDALGQGRISDAGKHLDRLEKELRQLREREGLSQAGQNAGRALELVSKLKAGLDRLNPSSQEMLTDWEKRELNRLAIRQQALEKRTTELKEALERLSQLLPMMDPTIAESLGGAAASMGRAATRLSEQDSRGAIPPEQEALQRLSRSQQALQNFGQQMAMRNQGNRVGMPMVINRGPGWHWGPWNPMPTLPQPEFREFQRERGYTGIDREEFQTPGKEAHKVPKIFREEIVKSLKEGFPSQFKRQVERYFKNLTD